MVGSTILIGLRGSGSCRSRKLGKFLSKPTDLQLSRKGEERHFEIGNLFWTLL